MRISDWSSDVCSSDLQGRIGCRGLPEEDRLTTPAMITVAITGSVPRKKDTPAVPVTPAEQVESTHEAYEAGATVVHIHVRDAEENASSDPALFAPDRKRVV